MKQGVWSVDDARSLRSQDGARRSQWHDAYGRHVQGLVQAAFQASGTVFGDRVYAPVLRRASARMNANCDTAYEGYRPKTTDVICSAYFKAGTNWIMHVCYQIAHLGQGEFAHIQDEIAWPDAAQPRYWRALTDDNASASPTGFRVVKSHLSAGRSPVDSPAKFIAMTRDPVDCAASGYHFFAKLYFGPMTPPPDVWLRFFGSDRAFWGPWFDFTASWWAERHRDNVLFLCFEDMKAAPEKTVAQIAGFLGVELSTDQIERVLERTSFKAMKAQNEKFYPVRQTIWSMPTGEIIRKGAVGDGNALFSEGAIQGYRAAMSEGLTKARSDFPFYDLVEGAS